ncbi:MAG: hypothetical protein ACXWT1_12320 [Methylobacter sp.]
MKQAKLKKMSKMWTLLPLLLPTSLLLAYSPSSIAKVPPATKQTVSLSYKMPTDIPASATQSQVDTFSWQTFVALNWPALPEPRGVPDPNKKIGDPGMTVWNTYKTTDELFLPNAQDPGPWNSPMVVGTPIHLSQTSKASGIAMKLSAITQPVGGPLTDQYGNLVYYQMSVNKTSYDFIISNKLYDATVQQTYGVVTYPSDTMEIKTAWRIMTPSDDQSRYYTRPAIVVGQDLKEKSVTVGLAGFHFSVKTPNAPQWVWATFEQVDNVPPIQNKVPSSFNSPTSTQQPNKETLPGIPTQVTRATPIAKDLQALNQRWQKALTGTVWQYYEQVGSQYPTVPNDPASFIGDPVPNILANTLMETYIQPLSSCIACHSTARSLNGKKSDFSFLLLHATSPATPTNTDGAK